MYSSYNKGATESGSSPGDTYRKQDIDFLLPDRRGIPGEAGSPPPEAAERRDSTPLTPNRLEVPQGEQDRPIVYHVGCIARGLWKQRKNLPLPALVALALLALYSLSLLVNLLVQMVLSSIGLVYTVLGIVASAIVIYEFFHTRQQKGP